MVLQDGDTCLAASAIEEKCPRAGDAGEQVKQEESRRMPMSNGMPEHVIYCLSINRQLSSVKLVARMDGTFQCIERRLIDIIEMRHVKDCEELF